MSLGVSSFGSIGSYGSSPLNSSIIKNDDSKTASFQDALENAAKSGDDKELRAACVDFESYFIKTMFKEMRKTIHSEDSFIPKSAAEETFQDMLDEEYSKNAANGKGIGLADYLYKQMSKTANNSISLS